MAHFIVEHSANLDSAILDLNTLFRALHQAAVDTGIFPLAGIRSRAHCCADYYIADGSPDFAFLHLNVRIGAGRSDDEKQLAAQTFFQVLTEHLNPLYQSQGLAISFELTELPEIYKFNQNNLRDYLAGRAK